MSDWGEVEAKLEAHLRTALGLSGSDERVTVGFPNGHPESFDATRFPHGVVAAPEETAQEGTYQESNLVTTYSVLLWTFGETHEATAAKADAFRDAVHGDRTLGGTVQKASVTSRSLAEHPDAEPMKAVSMEVTTEEVRA